MDNVHFARNEGETLNIILILHLNSECQIDWAGKQGIKHAVEKSARSQVLSSEAATPLFDRDLSETEVFALIVCDDCEFTVKILMWKSRK